MSTRKEIKKAKARFHQMNDNALCGGVLGIAAVGLFTSSGAILLAGAALGAVAGVKFHVLS